MAHYLWKVLDRQSGETVDQDLTYGEAMDYQESEEDSKKYRVVKQD